MKHTGHMKVGVRCLADVFSQIRGRDQTRKTSVELNEEKLNKISYKVYCGIERSVIVTAHPKLILRQKQPI